MAFCCTPWYATMYRFLYIYIVDSVYATVTITTHVLCMVIYYNCYTLLAACHATCDSGCCIHWLWSMCGLDLGQQHSFLYKTVPWPFSLVDVCTNSQCLSPQLPPPESPGTRLHDLCVTSACMQYEEPATSLQLGRIMKTRDQRKCYMYMYLKTWQSIIDTQCAYTYIMQLLRPA